MKKILSFTLIFLLALSLLTACGGNSDNSNSPGSGENTLSTPSGGNSNNTAPANQDTRVIKSSELITLEDAGRILGMDLVVKDELDTAEQFGGLRSVYEYDDGERHSSPTYMLQINIKQNELLDEYDSLDKKLKDNGGISFSIDSLKSGYETIYAENDVFKTLWVEGIGDWACINRSPIHTINIAYRNYSIGVTITGQATDVSRSKEDESAWKVEKLLDAGMLAIERLKAIVG